MKTNIEFKDFEPHESVKKRIDRLTSTLEKNATTLSPESLHLRLMVEGNSVRTLYNISITLDLPGKTLAAKEERHNLQAGLSAAFAEIERQLEKYKANLRQEHWKRPKRLQEIREMKAEAASTLAAENKRDEFLSLDAIDQLDTEIAQLKLENLIPDVETQTPEDEAITKDLRRSLNRALQEMPREWRHTLLLRDIEGRSLGEIAKKLGKTDSEINRILQSAHEYLRQRLIDAGFHFKHGEERAA